MNAVSAGLERSISIEKVGRTLEVAEVEKFRIREVVLLVKLKGNQKFRSKRSFRLREGPKYGSFAV